jgi:hypothetical protein
LLTTCHFPGAKSPSGRHCRAAVLVYGLFIVSVHTRATANAPDPPIPRRRQFVPRDRCGNPIPLWRYEYMTMAQRRATYGDPDEIELQAAARAEEDAMIEAARRGDNHASGENRSP